MPLWTRYEKSTPFLDLRLTTGSWQSRRNVQREDSAHSESKRSVVWDTLWTVDYNYESPSKR